MRKEEPNCPECGSSRVWRDGLRYPKEGSSPIQRYLCRSCGRRFSQPTVKFNITSQVFKRSKPRKDLAHNVVSSLDFPLKEPRDDFSLLGSEDVASHRRTVVGQRLNTFRDYGSTRRIGASEREAKNLAKTQGTRQKWAVGATKLTKEDIKGLHINFLWWIKKEGFAASTAIRRAKLIRQMAKHGVNLWDPDDVKRWIAQREWEEGSKANAVTAYSTFVAMEGLTWTPPRYKPREKLPFIPLESEIDKLIAATGKIVGTFLQGLKETGADPGELLMTKWIDINAQSRTLSINYPVKGHNPRILSISKEVIARFEMLPKVSERIFSSSMKVMYNNFNLQRKRLARKFDNPRLLKITFTTLRHWKATSYYHEVRDILKVKQLLGHKTLRSTMIYIDIEKAIYGELSQEFTVKVAEDPQEIEKLLEVGFEYVCEKDGKLFFRKRK